MAVIFTGLAGTLIGFFIGYVICWNRASRYVENAIEKGREKQPEHLELCDELIRENDHLKRQVVKFRQANIDLLDRELKREAQN